MTNITATYGANGYVLRSTGHAGTSQSCTAVSAIVQALAGWVHNHDGHISLQKGEAVIFFPEQDGAEAAMDMAVIGLLQVQQAAPNDVSVSTVYQVPGKP